MSPITITGKMHPGFDNILTEEALEFLVKLHQMFNGTRKSLLERRKETHQKILAGNNPTFLRETESIRKGNWQVDQIPEDLQDRRCEITGPAEAKMMINALNSGAKIFMADLEDSITPNWYNQIQGQVNLSAAYERTLQFTNTKAKEYRLNDGELATLIVRPRGWHLEEKNILIDGEVASGSLVDAGLYLFHNIKRTLEKGTGPYLYLPKLENHLEARLWDEVFAFAENELGVNYGTIKATVLLETILASFVIEEIIYELRGHMAGINAGRWDYMFSVIKKFRHMPDFIWPDRSQVTMTVPLMRAYTELLVQTCHKRGAHAIGGMAAFIPSRRDEEVNRVAMEKVQQDKEREAQDGFDGSWVAHPDLVPVCTEVFSKAFEEGHVNQKHRMREDVQISAEMLLEFQIPGGKITESGLRNNVSVGIQYIAAWLGGTGAVAIFNLMEDAATAEISRSQIWQWCRHPQGKLEDGRKITNELVLNIIPEELAKIRESYGGSYNEEKMKQATDLFISLVSEEAFEEFLTIRAYDQLD
ncbi:MAG: malate synthase A [SAR324 cluster bacterium]|nr:malate synthase A [SAR324 cluster bacterium]